MTKQDFIDHAFLALVSRGESVDSPELISELWGIAEAMYNSRPKTKKIKEERKKIATFIKPTPQEVDAYIKEIGAIGFTGDSFCNFYSAKGWKIGNQGMKDWRAAVRTWWHKYKEKHGRGSKPVSRRL